MTSQNDETQPRVVVQSQFSLRQMIVATSTIAFTFAIARAMGVAGEELGVGIIATVAICSFSILLIEARRQNNLFHNDRVTR